jgi:hypothetical protein
MTVREIYLVILEEKLLLMLLMVKRKRLQLPEVEQRGIYHVEGLLLLLIHRWSSLVIADVEIEGDPPF